MFDLISDNPFILAIVAGAVAEASAILLRRIAPVFGSWCWWLSRGLTLFAYLSLTWSLYWAIREAIDPLATYNPLVVVIGGISLLLGIVLIAWAMFVLGRRTFLAWPGDKLETRPPYRHLRRPMGLGVIFLGLGVAVILNTGSTWIWLLMWLIGSLLLYELEEWELRQRIPAAKEYHKKTPRYVPQFRKRSPSHH